MSTLSVSEEIYKRSLTVLPGGVNSPVRSFKEIGIAPMIVKMGSKDTIWDADGKRYIDFCMGWGSLILGHADVEVASQVKAQMDAGACFGITTEWEVAMAERVGEIFPAVDMVRFVSSGTEAVMSALRLARGFTGKNGVIKYSGNYHGHSDPFLVQAGSGLASLASASSLGIPQASVQHTFSLPYNDLETTRRILEEHDDIACIVVEPIAANMGVVVPSQEFILMLREESAKRGVLLIFDEVITGMRVGLRGSYEIYGQIPDLICLGKIVGGGLPAAAFGGRKEIMQHLAPLGGVYQAGTLSGSPLAMRAGMATIDKLKQPGFYQELQRKTNILLDPIQEAIDRCGFAIYLSRIASMFTLFFTQHPVRSFEDLGNIDTKRYSRFFQYLLSRGIYFSPSQYEACFVSIAHSDENLRYAADHIVNYIESEGALS